MIDSFEPSSDHQVRSNSIILMSRSVNAIAAILAAWPDQYKHPAMLSALPADDPTLSTWSLRELHSPKATDNRPSDNIDAAREHRLRRPACVALERSPKGTKLASKTERQNGEGRAWRSGLRAAYRSRTDDLRFTRALLYQLS